MNNNKRYKNPNYSRIKVQNNFNQSFKGDQFIQSPLDDDQEGGFIIPAVLGVKLLADKYSIPRNVKKKNERQKL